MESRKFPIEDLQTVTVESAVDILKLHPYLTLFSSNADFTTSFQEVLRLNLPGETVYITLNETEKWKYIFEKDIQSKHSSGKVITVLPFYHKKNLKRLLGKLYFAITVKGVSAYTGLLLLLYYLDAPIWLMISIAIFYWIFNLYVSDRVLKVAMDAKEVQEPVVIAAAEKVFSQAGITTVKVYETDSADYNGLATGMNIGRSMVTLTTATLQLPIEAIKGILAHEAVHVKKRDVMWGQLLWAGSMLIVVFSLLFIVEQISDIEAYMIPLFFILWILIILFPVYKSFYSQWMEVRADHLGATFLEGGAEQIAESLAVLAVHQDEALEKKAAYSIAKSERKEITSSLDRPIWFMRFLEFQMMPHPPMYWRVNTLRAYKDGWGKIIWKRWLKDRLRESFSFK